MWRGGGPQANKGPAGTLARNASLRFLGCCPRTSELTSLRTSSISSLALSSSSSSADSHPSFSSFRFHPFFSSRPFTSTAAASPLLPCRLRTRSTTTTTTPSFSSPTTYRSFVAAAKKSSPQNPNPRKRLHHHHKTPSSASAPQQQQPTQRIPSTALPKTLSFAKMKLGEELRRVVAELGWKQPTPIQAVAFHHALSGQNLVCSSKTGTGKTAAYGLPLLQKIQEWKEEERLRKGSEEEDYADEEYDSSLQTIARQKGQPLVLIVMPSRELAAQVKNELCKLAKYMPDISIVELSGSNYKRNQKIIEEREVDVLVATPGSLLRLALNGEERAAAAAEAAKRKAAAQKLQAVDRRISFLNEEGEGEEDESDDEEEEDDEEIDFDDEAEGESADEDDFDDLWEDDDEDLEQLPKSQTRGGIQAEHALIKLNSVRAIVLDECDKMLNMGFFPSIRRLYSLLPKPRKKYKGQVSGGMQTLLFSATLPPKMDVIIGRFAPRSRLINFNAELQPPEQVRNLVYFCSLRKKSSLLVYLFKHKGKLKGEQALVFVRTRQRADRLVEKLQQKGIPAVALHKGKSVAQRERAIQNFLSSPSTGEKEERVQCIVSTDLMARGIDLPKLRYVVNYDMPTRAEDFVHRVGRTGRAGLSGTSISLVAVEPQVIPQLGGKVVELNEIHYLTNVRRALPEGALKMEDKVPGRWQDPPLEDLLHRLRGERAEGGRGGEGEGEEEGEKEKQRQRELIEEGVKKIMKKKELKEMGKETLYEELRKRALSNNFLLRKRRTEETPVDLRLRRRLRREQERQQQRKELLKGKEEKGVNMSELLPSLSSNVATLTGLPSLRNFKEGRYEDVIAAFEEKRARKQGVAVELKSKKEKQAKKRKERREAREKEERRKKEEDRQEARYKYKVPKFQY